MPDKTNQERIIDNNDKIDEIKSKVSDLPDYQDLTQQTAIQSDVKVGKTFYNNSGILNVGTAPDTSIITETVTNTAELETITTTDFINNNLKVYKDTVFAFNKNKDKIYAKYNGVLSFVEIDTNPSSYEIGCVNVFKPNCIIIRVAYTNKLSLIEYDYSDRKFTKLNEINYLDVVDEDSFTLNSIALNPTRNLIAISSTGSHYYIYEIQNDYSLKKLFKDLKMLDHTSYALKWINPYNLNVGSTGLISDVLVTIYSDLTYTTYKRGYGSASALDPKPLAYNLEGTYCARGRGKPSGSYRSYFCTGQITIHKCTTNSKGVTTITKEILNTNIGEDTSGYSSYSVVWFNETTFGVYRYYYDSYTILYIYVINKSTDTVTMVKNYSYNSDKIQIYALNVGLGYLIYNPKQLIYYQVKLEGETHTIGAYINDNYFGTSMDTTATVTDLLAGKTAYSKNEIITGTMPNNGVLNYAPSTAQQTIPAGYTSGGTISAVTSAIDNNIQANNIKKDVEILGVTGTYEGSGGGSGDVKLFDTVEHMQQDADAQEGDLAVVYGNEVQPVTEESKFDSCIFPNVVVLDEAVTSTTYGSFGTVDMSMGYFDGFVTLSPTAYTIEGYSDTGAINIQYTSSDGITYTRTDGGNDLVEFGVVIQWQPAYGQFKSDYGKFMLITSNYFSGFYKYTHYEDEDCIKLIPISGVSYDSSTNTYMYDTSTEPIDKEISISAVYKVRNKLIADGILTSSINYFTVFLNSNLDVCVLISKGSSYSNNVIALDNNLNPVGMMSLSYPTDTTASTSSVYKLDLENLTYTLLADNIIEKQVTAGTSSGGVWYYRSYTDIASFCVYVSTSSYTLEDTFRVINNNVATGVRPSNVPTDLNVERTEYVLVDCQLDATADYVYGKTFYGKNGIEMGNIQNNKNLDMTTLRNRIITVYDSIIKSTLANDVTDLSSMFERCSDIITIPLFDTSNVTNMYRMFNLCQNLVEIPLLDTSNVTNMNGMLANCDKLTTIPQLDTSKATNMNAMFQSCDKLITIPLINTGNVKSMSNMFSGCKSLTSIPLLDTSNVTEMAYMFENCTSLTTVPQLDISKVTNTFDVFKGCTSLSNESLNNILGICIGATSFTSTKTLKYAMGLTSAQANICKSLSNYSAFIAAGWTTGY